MEIVLECSKIIQYDIESIKKSKFNNVCVDYDIYRKLCDSEIKMLAVKVNNSEIDIDNIKCKYLIVELGKWSYEEYVILGRKAKNNNVQILFENIYSNKNEHAIRNKFSDFNEIGIIVDKLNTELNAEVFGVCVDAYVCCLCAQDIYEFIINLKDKIKAVKISDCDEYGNNRILPFSIMSDKNINIDWQRMIRGLREINFNGEIILDCSDSIQTTSSLLLNATLEFVYAAGRYIEDRIKFEQSLKKYKSIVLFGAGFMFEVYMNSFGNKYPPIFACDNNKSLWGKIIRGVEIKDPEELKNISEDTVVLICNSIYYKEIQSQLLEMGIKNIEFFD